MRIAAVRPRDIDPKTSIQGATVNERSRMGMLRGGVAILIAALCCATPALVTADSFSIDAQVIVSGSAITIGNSCSRMQASIGQPAPGSSSGGGYNLSAGFWAIVPATGTDAVFFDSFEGCRP